jgi:hypothetical protein
MWKLLKEKTFEVLVATLPLFVVTIILQFTLVKASMDMFVQFLIGSILVIIGMELFLVGIDVGILPAGKVVGAGLTQSRSLWLILGVALAIGFAVTIAEPDVIVLAGQAESLTAGALSDDSLIYIMGIGVAFFLAIGMMRIFFGFPIKYLLAASLVIIIILSFFTPPEFVPLAFDSGSVTTGALTAPIVLAIGIGLTSVMANRSAIADGFGLLGLASLGPIIAVMIMGIVVG